VGTAVGVVVGSGARVGRLVGMAVGGMGALVGGAGVASLEGGGGTSPNGWTGVSPGNGNVFWGRGGGAAVGSIAGLTGDTWTIAAGLGVGKFVGVKVGHGVLVAITIAGDERPIPRRPHEQERAVRATRPTNQPAALRGHGQGRFTWNPPVAGGRPGLSLCCCIDEASCLLVGREVTCLAART